LKLSVSIQGLLATVADPLVFWRWRTFSAWQCIMKISAELSFW
jgi:hypothetical protein